jgi:transcriptional regulator with XRE-family HTH domain
MTKRVVLLLELMENQGWSQRKTADKLFVSLRTIEGWKAGDTNPGPRSARDIDDLLREYKII